MKNVPVEKIRNVIVVGHAASGKTSLVEAMLNKTGMTQRLGTILDKNTVSDCTPEEQERGVSIHGSNLYFTTNGYNVFIGDMPGYTDFVGQVVANAAVADSAIVVVDATKGVEVGAIQNVKILDKYGLPKMFVINKADKEGAKFEETLAALVKDFGNKCCPIVIPVGMEAGFKGVVSLFGSDPGAADPTLFGSMKTKLVEAVAETDDELAMKYLDEEKLSDEEVAEGFKKGMSEGKICPVLVTSATGLQGVQEVIDAILNYLPSPADKGVKKVGDVELKPDPNAPACAYVFKTVTDASIGQITFMRVYQGKISSGTEVQNQTSGQKERFGDLMIMQGKERITVDAALPGEIVAVSKLKKTKLNDTLGAVKVDFPPIEFPNPVMTVAVTAAKQGDEERISEGLNRLVEEDPTIHVDRPQETHELLVSGMGDVHLDVSFRWLKDKFRAEVKTATPKVAYHETIRGTADVRYRHKKQSGGAGQFGEVAIRLKPNERDKGYEFKDMIVGGVISGSFIPSVDKGIQSRMSEGVIAGCRVVDVIVELYDGKEHPVDSKDIAFQIAGRMAFSEAIKKADPILLEPIMNVTIACPSEFMGDINGNINSKRGQIMGMDMDGNFQVIKCQVPQAEMFRFCSELRSITGGSGTYSMEFSHYSEVPPNIAQQIKTAYEATKKKEDE